MDRKLEYLLLIAAGLSLGQAEAAEPKDPDLARYYRCMIKEITTLAPKATAADEAIEAATPACYKLMTRLEEKTVEVMLAEGRSASFARDASKRMVVLIGERLRPDFVRAYVKNR